MVFVARECFFGKFDVLAKCASRAHGLSLKQSHM